MLRALVCAIGARRLVGQATRGRQRYAQRRCDIRLCKQRVEHCAQSARSDLIHVGLLPAHDRKRGQDEAVINEALLQEASCHGRNYLRTWRVLTLSIQKNELVPTIGEVGGDEP
jgi:hypothetical protein